MARLRNAGTVACCLLTTTLVGCGTTTLVGCGLFRAHRPMTVRVIDGETRQPLAGAEVGVYYPNMLDFTAPTHAAGVTDEHGVVTLQVGEYHSTALQASRDGYKQVGQVRVKSGFVSSLPRHESGINYILELWADPAPTIEFVVPDGYRGPIKARFEVEDPSNYPPGQRTFTYRTDQAGRVTVKGPQFLGGENKYAKLVARYESGNVIPSEDHGNADTIAFRSINSGYPNQPTRLLLIGTGPEAAALYERTILRLAPNHIASDHEAYNRVFNE